MKVLIFIMLLSVLILNGYVEYYCNCSSEFIDLLASILELVWRLDACGKNGECGLPLWISLIDAAVATIKFLVCFVVI